MDATQLLTIAASLVAVLFTALITLLTWLGGSVIRKLEGLTEKLNDVATVIHERINALANRVTVIETTCKERRMTERQ